MRTKRYLQNHVVYQRTEMILRNPLASPVRGARQNGHASSHAFGWAQKAIYAGSMVISLDAGYRGDAEDFQPERQLIRHRNHDIHPRSSWFWIYICALAIHIYHISLIQMSDAAHDLGVLHGESNIIRVIRTHDIHSKIYIFIIYSTVFKNHNNLVLATRFPA